MMGAEEKRDIATILNRAIKEGLTEKLTVKQEP